MSQSDQCPMCRHKWQGALQCDAYPEGIPVEILTGEHDHREPFNGDNGIRFEQITDDSVPDAAK